MSTCKTMCFPAQRSQAFHTPHHYAPIRICLKGSETITAENSVALPKKREQELGGIGCGQNCPNAYHPVSYRELPVRERLHHFPQVVLRHQLPLMLMNQARWNLDWAKGNRFVIIDGGVCTQKGFCINRRMEYG